MQEHNFNTLFNNSVGADEAPVKSSPTQDVGDFTVLSHLPSKNKFYQSNILAQAPKVDDCMMISTITKENSYERYDKLLARRVRGIEPKNILSADYLYILIWLRETAYPGYGYTSEMYSCTKCSHKQQSQVQMNDISFSSNVDDVHEFTKTVIIDEHTFKIDLSTRFSDMIYTLFCNAIPANFDSLEVELLKKYAKAAVRVNIENCKTINERIDYIRTQLTPLQFARLIGEVKAHDVITNVKVNAICERCKTPNEAKFFFRTSYFLPVI